MGERLCVFPNVLIVVMNPKVVVGVVNGQTWKKSHPILITKYVFVW